MKYKSEFTTFNELPMELQYEFNTYTHLAAHKDNALITRNTCFLSDGWDYEISLKDDTRLYMFKMNSRKRITVNSISNRRIPLLNDVVTFTNFELDLVINCATDELGLVTKRVIHDLVLLTYLRKEQQIIVSYPARNMLVTVDLTKPIRAEIENKLKHVEYDLVSELDDLVTMTKIQCEAETYFERSEKPCEK